MYWVSFRYNYLTKVCKGYDWKMQWFYVWQILSLTFFTHNLATLVSYQEVSLWFPEATIHHGQIRHIWFAKQRIHQCIKLIANDYTRLCSCQQKINKKWTIIYYMSFNNASIINLKNANRSHFSVLVRNQKITSYLQFLTSAISISNAGM